MTRSRRARVARALLSVYLTGFAASAALCAIEPGLLLLWLPIAAGLAVFAAAARDDHGRALPLAAAGILALGTSAALWATTFAILDLVAHTAGPVGGDDGALVIFATLLTAMMIVFDRAVRRVQREGRRGLVALLAWASASGLAAIVAAIAALSALPRDPGPAGGGIVALVALVVALAWTGFLAGAWLIALDRDLARAGSPARLPAAAARRGATI